MISPTCATYAVQGADVANAIRVGVDTIKQNGWLQGMLVDSFSGACCALGSLFSPLNGNAKIRATAEWVLDRAAAEYLNENKIAPDENLRPTARLNDLESSTKKFITEFMLSVADRAEAGEFDNE